jgi:pyridoxal phosphate enzyme (YggS family)
VGNPGLTEIGRNLSQLRERIRRAAERAGRDPSEVQLVAVTKGFPPETIRLAAQAGLTQVGENRVEEALPKREALGDLPGLAWHMIGHLQSRKAALVPGAFRMVHSVDRPKIARLLDRQAGSAGLRLPVLLQCNVSGEASKSGWPLADRSTWETVLPEFDQIARLPHLQLMGLMTMAPLTPDPEAARPAFRTLRRLAEFLREGTPWGWEVLSMGMSDDFEIAVEEGATLLRIGRELFGPRPEG